MEEKESDNQSRIQSLVNYIQKKRNFSLDLNQQTNQILLNSNQNYSKQNSLFYDTQSSVDDAEIELDNIGLQNVQGYFETPRNELLKCEINQNQEIKGNQINGPNNEIMLDQIIEENKQSERESSRQQIIEDIESIENQLIIENQLCENFDQFNLSDRINFKESQSQNSKSQINSMIMQNYYLYFLYSFLPLQQIFSSNLGQNQVFEKKFLYQDFIQRFNQFFDNLDKKDECIKLFLIEVVQKDFVGENQQFDLSAQIRQIKVELENNVLVSIPDNIQEIEKLIDEFSYIFDQQQINDNASLNNRKLKVVLIIEQKNENENLKKQINENQEQMSSLVSNFFNKQFQYNDFIKGEIEQQQKKQKQMSDQLECNRQIVISQAGQFQIMQQQIKNINEKTSGFDSFKSKFEFINIQNSQIQEQIDQIFIKLTIQEQKSTNIENKFFQIQQDLEKISMQKQINDFEFQNRPSTQPRDMMKVYDLQFIKTQSQPLANQDQKQDFIQQNQEQSFYHYESSNISKAQNKQKKTTRFEIEDQKNSLDLAFLYADPLVTLTKENRLSEYTVPLDLEIEYQQIIENLKQTGKMFVITKKAMNTKSLSDIIYQNPKIIHISCHGSYDEEQKEFYLSIEDVNPNGKEYKFTKVQLQHILKLNQITMNNNSELNNSSHYENRFQKHGIKLAFVSACQSEEIGNIFLQSGIPVVIAVNSDQEIMDDACKLFSKTFYSQLLKGFSISSSFQQAQSNVQLTPNFETCCCAHTHDDDCVWYKFYKEKPIEAHEIHSKQCSCQQYGISGWRKHKNVCNALNEFKFFMRQRKQQELNNQPKTVNDKINVQGFKLAFANLQDSDEENLDFEIETKFQVISAQPQNQEEIAEDTDLIMCCCRKHQQHDETMKFILKSNQDEQGAEYKDEPIFDRYREEGDVIQLGQETLYKNRIPCHIDKKQLFGSQLKIHEIINFLTSSNRNHNRILSLNGKIGSGCSSLARFSVKYVMDRHLFSDGAYYISVENKNTAQSILKEISYLFKLPYNNEKVPFPYYSFKPLQILILIDKCQNIIQNDSSNLNKILSNFVEYTEYLKIIIISNQQIPLIIDNELNQFIQQIQVSPMEKMDTIKMILRICKNQICKQLNSEELSKHQMFNEFQFTPQEVSQICMLIENGTSLDKIYEIQKQITNTNSEYNQDNKNQIKNGTQQFNITMEIYKQIRENNPLEINLIKILFFAPSGMVIHDIFRIVLLNQQNSRPDKKSINFGQWAKFVESILNQEQLQSIQINSQLLNYLQSFFKKDDKLQTSFKQIQFKLIECKECPEVAQFKLQLNKQLISFMTYKTSADEKQAYALEYLKYMSLLSRQLNKDIQFIKNKEYDHYLLSSLINDGIWAEPKQLQYEMIFRDEYYQFSKDNLIETAINYFWFHESNFTELIEIYPKTFANILENNLSQDLILFSDELFVNFVSIYIQLNCISDACKTIKKIENICSSYDQLLFTSIKLKLIQASLELQIKKSDDDLRKIGLQIKTIEESTQYIDESKEIIGETSYLQAICLIKKMEKMSKNQQIQNPHNKSLDEMNSQQTKLSIQSVYYSDQSFLDLHHSQQSIVFKNQQINEMQLQKDFQNVVKLLKICQSSFISSIGIAKSWLLLAEFIHEIVIPIEELQLILQPVLQPIFKSLNENLEIHKESFQEFNYVQHIKCLLYQSKSLLRLQNYQSCKEKVIQCIEFSRNLNQKKLFNDAKDVLDSVSIKIEIKVNNYLVFAQACPINFQQKDQDFIIYKQTQDDVISFKNHLQKTNKQIDVKFEILNQEFIKKVKDEGCKILHLTPYTYKIYKQNKYLIFEDSSFNCDKITPQQLKQLFQKKIESLQIQLVIIEAINCDEFPKIFKEMGVKNIIWFKVEVQSNKCIHETSKKINRSIHHCSLNSEQNEYLKQQQDTLSAILFFNQFFYNFYFFLLQEETSIQKALEQSQKNACLYLKMNNRNLQIKAEFMCNDEQNTNKQFFQFKKRDSINDNVIKEGMICDISRLRAYSNIDSNQMIMTQPFIIRLKNYFSKLIYILINPCIQNQTFGQNDQSQQLNVLKQNSSQKLDSQQIILINVFGNKGSGKSRLVLEVAKFLKQRFMFGSGILHVDLKELKNFNQIYEILDQFKIQEHPQHKINHQKLENQKLRLNDLLFIFDNCDEFLKQNKTSFDVNLKHIMNRLKGFTENTLSIIFISQEKLHEQYKLIPFELEDFGFSKIQSHLFLQIINVQINENQLNQIQKLYEISKGNPQLLSVLNKINQITNLKVDLIDKIQILPLEKLQKDDSMTKSSNIKQIDGGFSTGLEKLAYFNGEVSSSKSIIGTRKPSILVLNSQFEQQNGAKELIDQHSLNLHENLQSKILLNSSLASLNAKQKFVNEQRQQMLFQSYQKQRKKSIQSNLNFIQGTQIQKINNNQDIGKQINFLKTMKTLQKFSVKKQEFINNIEQEKINSLQIPLNLGEDFKQQSQSFYLNQEGQIQALKQSKTIGQTKKNSLYVDLNENDGNSIKSDVSQKRNDNLEIKKKFEEQLDIFDSELEERNEDDEIIDEQASSSSSQIKKNEVQSQRLQCKNPSIQLMSSKNLPPINEKESSNEESVNLSHEEKIKEKLKDQNIFIQNIDCNSQKQKNMQNSENILKIASQEFILNYEGYYIEFLSMDLKNFVIQLENQDDQNYLNHRIKILHPANMMKASNKKQIQNQKTIISNIIPSEPKIHEINEFYYLWPPKEQSKLINRKNTVSSNIVSEDFKSQQNYWHQKLLQIINSQKSEFTQQDPKAAQIYEIMSNTEDFSEIEFVNIYVPQNIIDYLLFNQDSLKRLDNMKFKKRQSIVYKDIVQDQKVNLNNQQIIDFNKIYQDEKVSDDESIFDVFNPQLSEKLSNISSKYNSPTQIQKQQIKMLSMIQKPRNRSDLVLLNNQFSQNESNFKKSLRDYQIVEENIDSQKMKSECNKEDQESFIEDFDAFKSDEELNENKDALNNKNNDDSKNVWNILADSSYLQNILTYSKQSSKFSFLTKNNSDFQDSFLQKHQYSEYHIQNDLIEEEERDDIE